MRCPNKVKRCLWGQSVRCEHVWLWVSPQIETVFSPHSLYKLSDCPSPQSSSCRTPRTTWLTTWRGSMTWRILFHRTANCSCPRELSSPCPPPSTRAARWSWRGPAPRRRMRSWGRSTSRAWPSLPPPCWTPSPATPSRRCWTARDGSSHSCSGEGRLQFSFEMWQHF